MKNSKRLLSRRQLTVATGAALVASQTRVLPASAQTTTQATTQTTTGFDLDNGNALLAVFYPRYDTVSRTESLGRLTLTVDRAMLVEIPLFDAIAPYHPTAVGIFSDLGRRPSEEHTTRNKNIAVLYSAYTSLLAVMPQYRSRWVDMMTSVGLDPNDTTEDPTTPSGIGIMAAKNALAARAHDGSNREGDEGGRNYNPTPFADYTGYEPVNSPYELSDPSRWQPDVVTGFESVYRIEKFATPQYERVKPFTYDSPTRFSVPPPAKSNYHNLWAYRRQADQVLQASAGLDDRQKMIAEFFDDKVRTYGAVAGKVNYGEGYTTEQTVHYITMSIMTLVDTTIATWYLKRKFDSVRPLSAIRYLYGDTKLTAWGGPGRGTVSDITGNEWQGYLSSDNPDFPEYPSVSAALCFAFAQQRRRLTGNDSLDLSIPIAKGSSVVEPGITPASDMTLSWSTLSDFTRDCAMSRIWGGVGFPSAVAAAAQFAPEIGDLVFDFVQRKINGG